MPRLVRTLLFCLLLGPTAAAAQSSTVNASKYVELRQRLRADFLIMGTEPGMSMPAQERFPGDVIRWADGTIDLGWYIGVLASEYYLRNSDEHAGVDTLLGGIDTEDELALALLAMQRLDEQGEAAFPECNGVAALNGFFIRDDVPGDFHTNFAGMARTRSDFIDGPTLKEMSQDQVYHVLLGLALAAELVPDDVQARGISISQNAREQGERILRKMDDDNWLLKNPACDNRDVARGHSATAYSPGSAAAASWFTGGAFAPETSDVAKGIWDLARDPTGAFYQNVDNLHMSMSLAAIGQGWGDDDTLDVLMALAVEHRWYVYPLLSEVLHRNTNWCEHRDLAVGEARAMLDELPAGSYPENPQPVRAPHGYTQWNRFIRGIDSHYVGPAGNDGYEQHGLDYMLLHNLAAIAAPELWQTDGAPCVGPPVTNPDMGTQTVPDSGVTAMPDMGNGSDMRVTESDAQTSPPPGADGTTDDGCGCGVAPARMPRGSVLAILFALVALRRRAQPVYRA